ncbi:HNH endonuclease signature motif containing protein [Aeromonas dhakensis]|uniref:HNH endonuclease signature motif containing protein n=1 Tax=Aeromonas dhakensis TaxID=196024 RepID=UPI003987A077
MSQKLFLDALIGRDDFEVQDQAHNSQGPHKTTLSYGDFEIPGFFFSSLRKPDFQRETNEWDVEKVKDLVESFLDGDLVPAIILWKYADSYTFVIDGAHRISAIAAWVNDDYGDGKISRKFFDNAIPEQQIEAAKKARQLINQEIGSFKDFKDSLYEPELAAEHVRKRLKNFGTRALQLQWVDGDSKKAESSFFKINQKSTPISDTEISILEARRKPVGLCSRAILRGGQGYKYWNVFEQELSQKIQHEAEIINDLIFKPQLLTPIKTLDLPLGGKNHASNSLSMVFELVKLLGTSSNDEDKTGEETLKTLIDIRKSLQRVNDSHPSSLGLHPAIYIYSQSGNFRVSCFHAVIIFTKELAETNKLNIFTKYRSEFESIIVKSDVLIQQIVRKARQANKAVIPLVRFLHVILEKLSAQTKVENVLLELGKSTEFSYINLDEIYQSDTESSSFSKSTKSAAYISEAISLAPKCKICGGLLHPKSISIDHKVRKEDGGMGNYENAQLTHPYCNSTYKN